MLGWFGWYVCQNFDGVWVCEFEVWVLWVCEDDLVVGVGNKAENFGFKFLS